MEKLGFMQGDIPPSRILVFKDTKTGSKDMMWHHIKFYGEYAAIGVIFALAVAALTTPFIVGAGNGPLFEGLVITLVPIMGGVSGVMISWFAKELMGDNEKYEAHCLLDKSELYVANKASFAALYRIVYTAQNAFGKDEKALNKAVNATEKRILFHARDRLIQFATQELKKCNVGMMATATNQAVRDLHDIMQVVTILPDNAGPLLKMRSY